MVSRRINSNVRLPFGPIFVRPVRPFVRPSAVRPLRPRFVRFVRFVRGRSAETKRKTNKKKKRTKRTDLGRTGRTGRTADERTNSGRNSSAFFSSEWKPYSEQAARQHRQLLRRRTE
uniref:Uncharacterized protein n=1 Tax=Caenorhabditis japonica TaxID=281687 RepID=A0A8R1HRB5_CAEJA